MSAPADLTVAQRIATVLTCLAVDRRLGGVLFVDLPPTLLVELARWLNTALAHGALTGEIVTLGATLSDDDLWWQVGAPSIDGRFRFGPRSGPLVDPVEGPPQTVIIPDLARASLAVVRAAVVLIGTDHAVADRHGWHTGWQPRSRWLAACARSDIGRISPHLLDRFAVRVDAAELGPPNRNPQAMRNALDAPDDGVSALLPLPRPTVRGHRVPDRRLCRMTGSAADLVIDTIGDASAPARRDLALARTARALATLDDSDAVLDGHVRQAAVLLGFAQPVGLQPPPEPQRPTADSPAEPTTPEPGEEWARTGSAVDATQTVDPTARASLDDLNVSADLLRSRIYPEDDPDSLPDYASLREPWQRRSRLRALRGPVAGVEPTRGLADIALVATVLEAAKFQAIRRVRAGQTGRGLLIWGSDLRRYRRVPKPDTAIVLVLDHTCRRGWDWAPALAPYLRWAYTQRAPLTLIELGHLSCADELRAETYRATTILDSRVAAALDRAPGRATPLAYALDLAVQELRRRLRHGGATAERAWLVVASDGRGNVPLEASQRGRRPGFVSREGLTDALAGASAIRSLPTVRPVVIPPPSLAHYAELPFDLADAMGGIVAATES